MTRREFIAFLGCAATAWPLASRALQRDRLRRVAVVMQYVESDPQGHLRAVAFREGLERAGWMAGRNINVDYLWGVLDSEGARSITEHLRQQVPDVIAINSSTGLRAIESAAPGVPIVFIAMSEPVALGLVASLAHPGGNMTGFSNLEPTLGAKWLGLSRRRKARHRCVVTTAPKAAVCALAHKFKCRFERVATHDRMATKLT
jgi:putative tryptophan/tyrosine transport system substrate-binding protein